jgi:CPA1 family monovalent cation:H+ antiporter
VAILLTLVVQGLTLPYIIGRFKPFQGLLTNVEEEKETATRLKIKTDLKHHVYSHIKNKYENEPEWAGHVGMERILKHWEDQSTNRDVRWIDEKTKTVLLEMFELQRNYLHDLNLDPKMDEEIIRHQIYQIDLEEERVKYV